MTRTPARAGPRAARRDEGVATVWAVALLAVISVVAMPSMAVAGLAAARQRAGAVADLAALAAAAPGVDGCDRAADVAQRNSSLLLSCTVDGLDVVVVTAVPAPQVTARVLGWLGHEATHVSASARAGPPTG